MLCYMGDIFADKYVIVYVPMLLDISRLLQEQCFYVPDVGHGMIRHT